MPGFASEKLLTAALGGLLVLAPACSATSPGSTPPADSGVADAADAAAVVDATAPDATVDATVDAADDAAPEASIACEAGVSDAPEITSTQIGPGLSLEDFTDQCTEQGGTVEIEPHCGGENSCRGMSYDTNTETLSEHTCKGMNTCAGYSCIICD